MIFTCKTAFEIELCIRGHTAVSLLVRHEMHETCPSKLVLCMVCKDSFFESLQKLPLEGYYHLIKNHVLKTMCSHFTGNYQVTKYLHFCCSLESCASVSAIYVFDLRVLNKVSLLISKN